MDQSVSRVRHLGGFVLAGILALLTDIAVLSALMGWLDWTAALARPVAISVAMVVSWAINRTVTFAVAAPPTFREFLKFAAASWLAQLVNYLTFLAILELKPTLAPSLAVIAASLVAMGVAYAGFRFGVFRKPEPAVRGAQPPATQDLKP